MMRRMFIAVIALGALALGGCSRPEARAAGGEVGTMTVDELVRAREAGGCVVLDANSTQTRILLGVIPGARLLTHYSDYELDELPADRDEKLVFYCANEHCSASHAGAERALLAGYTDVQVLSAGVAGWRQAGKPTIALQAL